jgi:hypothetical protein
MYSNYKNGIFFLFIAWSCLEVAYIKAMEGPRHETKKQEGEAPGAFEEIPHELVVYISNLIPEVSQRTTQAIRGIKAFMLSNKLFNELLSDPRSMGSLIQLLSTHSERDPIEIAILFRNSAATEWLRNYLKDHSQEGYKLLMDAIAEDRYRIIEGLTKAGIDVNKLDAAGRTPLMYAVSPNKPNTVKIVDLLIKAGTNLNVADTTGKTVLDIANINAIEPVKKLLQKAVQAKQNE